MLHNGNDNIWKRNKKHLKFVCYVGYGWVYNICATHRQATRTYLCVLRRRKKECIGEEKKHIIQKEFHFIFIYTQ
jgi:hypothetical protein